MYQVRKDSRLQLKEEILLTPDEAQEIVKGYRFGMAPAVPKAWKTLTRMIPLLNHDSGQLFGPMTFRKNVVYGPTGLPLFYEDLHQQPGDKGLEWRFRSGRMHKRLFGGKFYENIIQHLARCCNFETAHKVRREYGKHAVRLGSQAHDELIYSVPGWIEYGTDNGKPVERLCGFAADFKDHIEHLMSERPAWGPDIPLAAEAGFGYNYGDAK